MDGVAPLLAWRLRTREVSHHSTTVRQELPADIVALIREIARRLEALEKRPDLPEDLRMLVLEIGNHVNDLKSASVDIERRLSEAEQKITRFNAALTALYGSVKVA